MDAAAQPCDGGLPGFVSCPRREDPSLEADMASDQGFVDYVLDQLEADCGVTARKMFGEYGLYASGAMIGMICDNRLFLKPTEGGRAHIGNLVEAPPYPGAKPIFLIEAGIDDGEWLSELVRITTREMPVPKPKKRKTG
jgi:TfoX/Sxy family transcriptional regulator of competence genes